MKKIYNKFLIILVIFVLLISSFIINSFASANNIITFYQNDLNKDIQVTIPDVCTTDYKYYLLSSRKTGDYLWTVFAYSNSPFYVNDAMIYCKSDFYFYYLREYETYSTKHDFSSVEFTHIEFQEKIGLAGGMHTAFNSSCIVSASYSVYKYDIDNNICLDDEVVFQGAPPEIVEPEIPEQEMIQLTQIVEQAEPKKVMAEVVGILPLILMIIVGLIGLRKALEFLQKLLRKS